MNDEVLQAKVNNFLASIYFANKSIGIAFLDVSTGEFLTAQGNAEYVDKLLQNFNPSEVLVPKTIKTILKQPLAKSIIVFIWKIGCIKRIMHLTL